MWGVFVPMNPAWGVEGGVFEEKSLMMEELYFNLSLHFFLFLGAFSKLRKATISFIVSVRPSVCPSARI